MGTYLTSELLSQIADMEAFDTQFKWVRTEGSENFYIGSTPGEHHRHLKPEVTGKIVDAGRVMPTGSRRVYFGDGSTTLNIPKNNIERANSQEMFRRIATDANVTPDFDN